MATTTSSISLCRRPKPRGCKPGLPSLSHRSDRTDVNSFPRFVWAGPLKLWRGGKHQSPAPPLKGRNQSWYAPLDSPYWAKQKPRENLPNWASQAGKRSGAGRSARTQARSGGGHQKKPEALSTVRSRASRPCAIVRPVSPATGRPAFPLACWLPAAVSATCPSSV